MAGSATIIIMTSRPIGPQDIVVISGCGSGIGRATATHLANLGYTVIAGVRSQEQADGLRQGAADRLQPFIFDVTKAENIADVVAHVERMGNAGARLRGIFSNAGVEGRSADLSAEGCSVEDLRKVMEVNYFGAVRFIQGFLPLLRRDRGTAVINSAMMARIVLPFNGGYAPSKAALESWATALRREIAPHGVSVVLIELGGIATPLTEHAGDAPAPNPLYPQQVAITSEFAKMARDGAKNPKMSPMRPAELVAQALAAPRPRVRYIGGGGAHLLAAVSHLPQRVQDALIARMLKRGRSA